MNNIRGKAPAIALINPKLPHNVGAIVRTASCFGTRQVWMTGNRVSIADKPMPHQDVELRQSDNLLAEFESDVVLIGIETKPGADLLPNFVHPNKAVYIFGPEDGSIPEQYLSRCHKIVAIPTAHCLSLSSAVSLVLYDRLVKRAKQGLDVVVPVPVLVQEQTQEDEEAWYSLVQ